MPSLVLPTTLLAAWSLLSGSTVEAKAVFCHYLVGTVDSSTNHAQLDITQAQALGFDAFALNLGAPTQSFESDTVEQLFNQAGQAGFKLFFSLDMSADSNLDDFNDLLKGYLGNDAYYRAGPNNYPVLSTFDYGSHDASTWSSFLQSYANELYFIPDFDDAPDYYTDPNSFFTTWNDVVDGVFSWESAWPLQMTVATNVSTDTPGHSDQQVQSAAQANNKAYMIGLSSLQFKDLDIGHYYRVGEVNLPQRMTEILALGQEQGTTAPDFVEVITWNDAGESHYIGNIWSEGLSSAELAYANQDNWPHAGWQPLVASFITAYKAGGDASSMTPPSGNAVGAMWYRTILQSASCSSDPAGKPPGWQAGKDAVNWAVVVAESSGYQVRTSSGGTVLQTVPLSAGLNYGSVPGMTTGAQLVELLDGGGNVVMKATSVMDVQADSTDVCNYNYQVAGLQ